MKITACAAAVVFATLHRFKSQVTLWNPPCFESCIWRLPRTPLVAGHESPLVAKKVESFYLSVAGR